MNPSTPAAPAPATSSASTSSPMVAPHSKEALSEGESAQLAAWAKEDFAKGKLTQAQLDRQFDDLDTPQEERVLEAPLPPDQQKLNALHPPERESEYTIRYGGPDGEMVQTPELKQFDASARAWLSGAEFDRVTGNSLVTTIDRVMHQTHKMTPEQLQFYGEQQYALLEKSYGAKLEEKLNAAGRMVQEIEKVYKEVYGSARGLIIEER